MPYDSNSPENLCIPIYLNQHIVFDLLAIIDDGFTNISKIKVSSKESEINKSDTESSLGLNNTLAFISFKLGRTKNKEAGNEETKERIEERTHTPSSLFARLRKSLYEKEVLHDITSINEINTLKSGDFVEFSAILRKNPIIEICEKTNMVFNLVSLTQNLPNNNTNMPEKKKDQRSKPIDQNLAKTKQLVDNLLIDLTKLNSVEIIGEVLDAPGLQAVLSSKTNYFLDQNGSEIIDGEFKVLGKIVRVIKTENEGSINLLRKTSLSILDSNSFEVFTESLQAVNTAGLKIPKMVAELKGPLIQVIPISIFT